MPGLVGLFRLATFVIFCADFHDVIQKLHGPANIGHARISAERADFDLPRLEPGDYMVVVVAIPPGGDRQAYSIDVFPASVDESGEALLELSLE